jgi:hypothetical protein
VRATVAESDLCDAKGGDSAVGCDSRAGAGVRVGVETTLTGSAGSCFFRLRGETGGGIVFVTLFSKKALSFPTCTAGGWGAGVVYL